MRMSLARLRAGEWLVGVSSVALLVFLLVLPWDAPRAGRGVGRQAALTGWHAAPTLRWFVVVAALAGLVLFTLQVTRRPPAMPVTMSVVATVIALVAGLAALYRVALSPLPHQRVGAVLELLAACGLLGGAFWSMREEGIAPPDAPRDIPVVSLRGG
jgi:hypothetical protein